MCEAGKRLRQVGSTTNKITCLLSHRHRHPRNLGPRVEGVELFSIADVGVSEPQYVTQARYRRLSCGLETTHGLLVFGPQFEEPPGNEP